MFLGTRIVAQEISSYDVVWHTPSDNAAGSMPLGNGEMGANVWVEKNGNICFYLSRTDTFSEADRLLKVGRIRVSVEGNPFGSAEFEQRLNLYEGVIELRDSGVHAEFYFDPDVHVAYLVLSSDVKREIRITAESWRNEPRTLGADTPWTVKDNPFGMKFIESADRYISLKKGICWYHRNENSVYDLTLRHQQLQDSKSYFPDPITNLIFGGYVSSSQMIPLNDSTLVSKGAVKHAVISIATYSEQLPLASWLSNIQKTVRSSSPVKALEASRKKWAEVWSRSYIYIETPEEGDLGYRISQAYALQRFMSVASGKGRFPIRFNGSIFTVDPEFTRAWESLTPDHRAWGNCYWWQNTRFPYYSMLAAGDYENMLPLFDFYGDRFDAFKCLASRYYGAKGLFIPETVTLFGTYSNGDYGWEREKLGVNKVASPWIGKIWVQSLELSKLAMDYYFYTGDTSFLRSYVVPLLTETLLYFDSRFIGSHDRICIDDTQALEAYWYHVKNDMPTIAGLHAVVKAALKLPVDACGDDLEMLLNRVQRALVTLPIRRTIRGEVFKVAEEYTVTSQRDRSLTGESPELYAVFPFGLVNFSNDSIGIGRRTYERRIYDGSVGWGQDGINAVILGLVDESVANLKIKLDNSNKNFRFPVMWGPNHDWVPDQDHGSNLMLMIQGMLYQHYDGIDYLLPTFPKNWNARFRLAVPGRRFVEAEFKHGKCQRVIYNYLEN